MSRNDFEPTNARQDGEYPAPLLANHQRLVSGDIKELHDAVEPLAVGHDLHAVEPGKRLNGSVNGLTIGSVSLVWVRYGGAGVVVETPPTQGEFAMCAPGDPMEYHSNSRRGVAGGSLVLSHEEKMRMKPHPQLGCLVIATSTGRLTDHLRDYLGVEHPLRGRPLRFDSVEGPAVMSRTFVDRTWRQVCSMLDHISEDGIHPFAARNFEEAILNALLLGLPNTATPHLGMTGHSSRSDSAKFVWEWLEAHHQQPIGVADIAAAAGVSIRQLQVVCKEHWGQTPVQLLRGIRLDHARREILSGRSEFRRIGDVARAAGYVHMSRFAAHYKRRFGETPSQTLQRIRTR